MRKDINTLIEHTKGQQMTVVHTLVLNNTTNNSMSSVPNKVRNVSNFQFGCTTSSNTSHSLLTLTSSQLNYNEDNEDNYNEKTHKTVDNKENDCHSNQDPRVNCRRKPKRRANETSRCAQGVYQTKCPRNDETPY